MISTDEYIPVGHGFLVMQTDASFVLMGVYGGAFRNFNIDGYAALRAELIREARRRGDITEENVKSFVQE